MQVLRGESTSATMIALDVGISSLSGAFLQDALTGTEQLSSLPLHTAVLVRLCELRSPAHAKDIAALLTAPDAQWNTPFHHAVMAGSPEILRMLQSCLMFCVHAYGVACNPYVMQNSQDRVPADMAGTIDWEGDSGFAQVWSSIGSVKSPCSRPLQSTRTRVGICCSQLEDHRPAYQTVCKPCLQRQIQSRALATFFGLVGSLDAQQQGAHHGTLRIVCATWFWRDVAVLSSCRCAGSLLRQDRS